MATLKEALVEFGVISGMALLGYGVGTHRASESPLPPEELKRRGWISVLIGSALAVGSAVARL